jgi:hypothetical protein
MISLNINSPLAPVYSPIRSEETTQGEEGYNARICHHSLRNSGRLQLRIPTTFFQIVLQDHFITGLEVQAIRRRISLTQVLP